MAVDGSIYGAVAAATAVVLALYLIAGVSRWAGRDGLTGLAPILLVALGVRLAVAGFCELVPALRVVRGPDEAGFESQARALADGRLSFGLLRGLVGNLHIEYMSWQIRIFGGTTDFFLRVGNIALAVTAIAVLAITVTRLVGPAWGRLAAWGLAFEPSSLFFSTILHKEASMYLGEALVVYGCVRMHQRRDVRSAVAMVAGVVIADGARPYAAGALLAACGLTAGHAALRRLGPDGRRSPTLFGIVATLAVLALVGGAAVSGRLLDGLQRSQQANASDGSNLSLAPVDFSTPAGIAVNLPRRVFDVSLRPFPWQVANTNQWLGAFGSCVAWALIAAAAVLVLRRRTLALARLPALAYVFACLLVTYALTTGNAGTGFRYRSHLIVLLVLVVASMSPRGLGSLPDRLPRLRSRRAPIARAAS